MSESTTADYTKNDQSLESQLTIKRQKIIDQEDDIRDLKNQLIEKTEINRRLQEDFNQLILIQNNLNEQIIVLQNELKVYQALEEKEANYDDDQYVFLRNRLRQFDGEIQRNQD